MINSILIGLTWLVGLATGILVALNVSQKQAAETFQSKT